MKQVFFTLPVGGGLKIYGYGVMLAIAFFAAGGLASWRARREKLDPLLLEDLAFWMILGGLIGARAIFVWEYWRAKPWSFWSIFKIWEGGIVFYGSVLGGLATFLLYRLVRPFPVRPVLDVIAPSLALGIAIGRIGCFLNGCCYGDRCDLAWGVSFPKGSLPYHDQLDNGLIDSTRAWSLPVHPTQIYSAIDGFLLLGLLSAFFPHRRRDGEVMALLMVAYPVSRFLIERLRNDEGVFAFGMTISQNISVFLLIAGLINWFVLSYWPKERYADKAAAVESK